MTEALKALTGVRIISPGDWGPDLGVISGGTWREIVGPATAARCRSMYAIDLGAGGLGWRLQHDGEAVYYVADGDVIVVEHLTRDETTFKVAAGAMIHIPSGIVYHLESVSGARVVGGPSPVGVLRPATDPPGADVSRIAIHHCDGDVLQVPFISRDARLVVWLGKGAVTANMNYVVLEPGERNKEHVHAESEDTIHILAGRGTAENVTTGERLAFGPGDTIHIEIGFWHAVTADRGERVVSVGGPRPADIDMLRAAGVDVDDLVARFGRA